MYPRLVKILNRLSRWWRFFRVTSALFTALDAIFRPFRAAGLVDKLRSDEFVIAYLYGVMVRFFEVYATVGLLQSGQILWKCYERAFPGYGKEIVELTVVRIQAKNETFLRDLRRGTREAREYLASKGKSGFPTLTSYLTIQG